MLSDIFYLIKTKIVKPLKIYNSTGSFHQIVEFYRTIIYENQTKFQYNSWKCCANVDSNENAIYKSQ